MRPVPVPYELLCEVIGELEWWADAHDESKSLSRQRARDIRRYVRKLDQIRMRTMAATRLVGDGGALHANGN